MCASDMISCQKLLFVEKRERARSSEPVRSHIDKLETLLAVHGAEAVADATGGVYVDGGVEALASHLTNELAKAAKDGGAPRVTREAAMAKLFATDQAQVIIDKAVQLHGGDGVKSGETVEKLYREIRALRIYEGASDVQRVIIARQALGAHRGD